MKILIVDDDRTNLTVLRRFLEKDGHRVVEATDGLKAVELFVREQPDMVLMDVMMPALDGYEATRRIKAACGERFVPVIFVTALTDDQALAKCVECGGDDFLTKPYNRVIIRAKVEAMARIGALHRQLGAQNAQLEEYKEETERELQFARHIFFAATLRKPRGAPYLQHWERALGHFSGDLLCHEHCPCGRVHVMLADFTGHGLAAAIGALPAADIFYSMTLKGFGIADIAAEINKKLNFYLPTGHFCSACLIAIDVNRGRVEIWNGGMPPVLVLDSAAGIQRRVTSTKLPLGVAAQGAFDRGAETLPLDGVESLLVYSDGLVEARNAGDEEFQSAGLEQVVAAAGAAAAVFDLVQQRVVDFIGPCRPTDDISLLEIRCRAPELAPSARAAAAAVPANMNAVNDWSIALHLGTDAVREIDPLPMLMDWLQQVRLPEDRRGQLYTVLAELINNAVDHGLLDLDSALKDTADGFTAYYRMRGERLQALANGALDVTLAGAGSPDNVAITVRVEDTGPGFDVARTAAALDGNRRFSGRGIALVRSLCAELNYLDRGNRVEAHYSG